MKFSDYNIIPEVKESLNELGFRRPTDIQYKSIIPILKGEDILAIAQTGTGKTAAFAIPIISTLEIKKDTQRRPDGIKCVVMVPTRELAQQIRDVFEAIAKHTRVRVFSVFGGVEQGPQIAALEEGIDILITTPGRMFDLVHQGHIRLHRVETLVLDEADQMLALGFYKDIQDVMRFLPKRRQTLFFSATINPKIKDLAYSLVTKAIRIQVSPKDPVSKNVRHSVAFVEMDDKRVFLERLINENPDKKILVFVRTKIRAERVMKAMERVNIQSETIHGDKDQKDRALALERFKSYKNNILIATDVTARGIDIPNVEYVVNYDIPEPSENYVHRVGRTGRGKHKGIAISFCSEQEKELLDSIEGFLNTKINISTISKEDYFTTKDLSHEPKNLKSVLSEIQELTEIEHKKKKSKKAPKKKKGKR